MSRSAQVSTRGAIITLLRVHIGLGERTIQWEIEQLGLPPATPEDFRFVGAYRYGPTDDYRLNDAGNQETRIKRGQTLCDLSYNYKSACPEWREEKNALLRRWILEDILTFKR